MFDNPQPPGPRSLVGKGWIFMSFRSRGAFLVGRNFNCGCVGDLCTMTPRKKRRIAVVIGSVLCQKISKGGSEMRNFTTFLRT